MTQAGVTYTNFARWNLARLLRDLREGCQMTQAQLAKLLDVDVRTVRRDESGEADVPLQRIYAICYVLKIRDSQQQQALVQMAENAAKGDGVFDSHGAEEWWGVYRGAERHARSLSVWEPGMVWGPWQIPEYVRAVCQAGRPPVDEEGIQTQIRIRLERQSYLLDSAQPPHVQVLMGALATFRPVGGPEVLTAQVGRLLEIDRHDNVDIRVLPRDVGAHPLMATGSFAIVRFPQELGASIVYDEGLGSAQYHERPDLVIRYAEAFAAAWDLAIPIERHVRERSVV